MVIRKAILAVVGSLTVGCGGLVLLPDGGIGAGGGSGGGTLMPLDPGPSQWDGGTVQPQGTINAGFSQMSTFRGQNGRRVSFVCEAIGTSTNTVWGTGVYTDDSSVCRAAVHAGVMLSTGGPVTVEVRPGRDSYAGSVRNGVESSNYGRWSGSFVFVP
jgi:hypothetical protein